MEEENKKIEKEIVKDEDVLIENSNEPQKGIPPELEKMIKTKIRQMSNGVFSEEEQEDIYDNLSKKEILANREKENLERYLNREIKKIIIEKLDEKNKENNNIIEQEKEEPMKEKEKQIEDNSEENIMNDKENEEITISDQENSEEKTDVPEDVKRACENIGVNKIKGYFYVKEELGKKVDGTLVDEDRGDILIIQVESEKVDGPDKYYGFQDEKMVLYANEDQAVREVTGEVTKMGQIVEPLKLQEPKAVEFSDGNGWVVNEQIDDNSELSVQEANNYRDEMEEHLEKYSQNIELIKSDSTKSKEEKIEMLNEVRDKFGIMAEQIAEKYDIGENTTEKIDEIVEEDKLEDIKEVVEEEQNDEEYDDRGLPRVPGKIYRGD